MKSVQSYIDESLFSGQEVDTNKLNNQLLLDEFKKYTPDAWGHNIWFKGKVSADDRGLVIRFPDGGQPEDCFLTLSGLKGKKSPEFNIYRITGVGTIEITDNDIETLEGIFDPNCECGGQIRLNIYENENLTSLKDCPKKIWYFACDGNKKLDDWEGAPREADRWDYLDSYKGIPYVEARKFRRLHGDKRKEKQEQIDFRKKEFKKYTNNKIKTFTV